MIETCFTCGVVNEYVTLANAFTQDLSDVLLAPMWAIFLSLTGLWIVIHGIKMTLGRSDIKSLGQEFVFVALAAVLMAGQGPTLVNQVYSTALSIMGGAASAVLSAGTLGDITGVVASGPGGMDGYAGIANVDGMSKLVWTAENGVFKLVRMAGEVMAQRSGLNFMPVVYGVLLALPYVLLLIIYFAQVVVSIFRIMMFAALSPILMLLFAFGWGQGMAATGIKTVFSAFMVLFGATVALAVCLYGVQGLDVGAYQGDVSDVISIDSSKLWVAILLGWLGFAFVTEATGMANSIAGSQFTNTAVASITGGIAATGIAAGAAAKNPANWARLGGMGMGAVDGARYGVGAVLDPKGAAGAAGSNLSATGKAIMERIKTPTFDRG